jgi:SAM-dependent methyltransferase
MTDRNESRLLDDAALLASTVVANNTMNRERGLTGVNSYTRELGFDPTRFLTEHADTRDERTAAWLDLCCGSGRALLEAGAHFEREQPAQHIELTGVDLVDFFLPVPPPPSLTLIAQSATNWRPNRAYDLITCVHGLHYIGDKLALLTAAASWLSEDGMLVAHLDPHTLRHPDGTSAARDVLTHLRAAGTHYDARTHRLICHGPRPLQFPADYLGADDTAGPGYTGQPAVASYYTWP